MFVFIMRYYEFQIAFQLIVEWMSRCSVLVPYTPRATKHVVASCYDGNLSLHLVQKRTFKGSFLSLIRQCQSIEGNSEQWVPPVTVVSDLTFLNLPSGSCVKGHWFCDGWALLTLFQLSETEYLKITRKHRQSYRHADPRWQRLQVAQGYTIPAIVISSATMWPWRFS